MAREENPYTLLALNLLLWLWINPGVRYLQNVVLLDTINWLFEITIVNLYGEWHENVWKDVLSEAAIQVKWKHFTIYLLF